jgi:hypothetical protein
MVGIGVFAHKLGIEFCKDESFKIHPLSPKRFNRFYSRVGEAMSRRQLSWDRNRARLKACPTIVNNEPGIIRVYSYLIRIIFPCIYLSHMKK